MKLLNEENYVNEIKTIVVPYLEEHGEKATWGKGLYYEFYPLQDCKGTIVISHGFTETTRKFREMIYYFHQAGYQVAMQEHAGHGNSYRLGIAKENPDMIHLTDFEEYVKDLHDFTEQIVLPKAQEKPLYLFAHSMGGCIAARVLEEYPSLFKKAILSAPMIGLLGPISVNKATAICRVICALGFAQKGFPFSGKFNSEDTFETACNDSESRFWYYQNIRVEDRSLQMNHATYAWVLQSLLAGKRVLNPENMAKIKTPFLLMQAKRDTLVDPSAQDKLVAAVPVAQKMEWDSRHEIYFGTNATIEEYLKAVFTFYQEG